MALPRIRQPLFDPMITADFRISPSDGVYARREHCDGVHFAVSGSRAIPQGVLNKYTPPAIVSELRWALDPTGEFPQSSLVRLDDGRWLDPRAHPALKCVGRMKTLARRRLMSAATAHRDMPSRRDHARSRRDMVRHRHRLARESVAAVRRGLPSTVPVPRPRLRRDPGLSRRDPQPAEPVRPSRSPDRRHAVAGTPRGDVHGPGLSQRHSASLGEPPHRVEELPALLLRGLRIARGEGPGYAVLHVVVEDGHAEALERGVHGGDLREDVDAVTVVLDHALDAAHLALDPVQALGQRLLL